MVVQAGGEGAGGERVRKTQRQIDLEEQGNGGRPRLRGRHGSRDSEAEAKGQSCRYGYNDADTESRV